MGTIKSLFIFSIIFFIIFSVIPAVYSAERDVIILFSNKPGQNEESLISNAGGNIKKIFKLIPAFAARIPEEALDKIMNHSSVVTVEDDDVIFQYPLKRNSKNNHNTGQDPAIGGIEYENSWGCNRIGCFDAHDQNVMGAGVRISILDTGIDYNHPELADNYQGGENFISIDPDNHDPFDDSINSHGTHVAGIIAGIKNGSGIVGVAPEAKIYAVKVLDGAGFGSISSLISGIEYSVANQMDIINISLMVSYYSQSLEDACNAAYQAGLLLIAAAGNSYGHDVLYPARFDSVVAVAATNPDDTTSPLNPIGFEVELVAPGVDIYSTIANDNYGYLTGTSQACPHVTGIAALVFSANNMGDLNNDGISDHRDVRLMLQLTSLDLGETGRDYENGFGIVNTEAAGVTPSIIQFTVTKKKRNEADTINKIFSGRIFEIFIKNNNLRKIKVAVYDDNGINVSSKEYRFKRRFFLRRFFFKKNKSEVNFTLDATGKTLHASFIPYGKPGSFADITIK